MDKMVGGYRLLEKIGRGGFGAVWRAAAPGGGEVALKVVHPEHAGDPSYVARMINEFALLMRLDHPNIVRVHSVLSHDGRPVLVMDLVRGRNLAAELSVQAVLPLPTAALLLEQVCAALDCAHRADIVHRDIKPDNILLESRQGNASWDHARLVDFGIALLSGGTRHTATGLFVGSPAYVAPELIRGDDASPASDMYAVGLLATECLTGRRLFEGGSIATVFDRHLNATPELPNDWSVALTELIAACLDKDPSGRPSAEEASARFAAMRDVEPEPVHPVVVDLPVPSAVTDALRIAPFTGTVPTMLSMTSAPKSTRKPTRSAVAVAAVLGAATLAAVLAVTSPQPVAGSATAADSTLDGTPKATAQASGASVTNSVTETNTSSASATAGTDSDPDRPSGEQVTVTTRPTDAQTQPPSSDTSPTPAPLPRQPVTLTNNTDIWISDNTANKFSGTSITIPDSATGRFGDPGVTVVIDAVLRHERRGDLTIRLIAPNGGRYTLIAADPADHQADFVERIDLAGVIRPGVPVAGTWRLLAGDSAAGVTGRLDSWSITY